MPSRYSSVICRSNGFKALDQRQEPLNIRALFIRMILNVRHRLDRFHRHQHAVLTLLPDHVRRRDIVRHAIHPRSKRAPAIEPGETAPQRHVNILQQVAAFFRIDFISARQAVQRPAIAGGCLPIQLVLLGIRFYVQIVARARAFLQEFSVARLVWPQHVGPQGDGQSRGADETPVRQFVRGPVLLGDHNVQDAHQGTHKARHAQNQQGLFQS